MKTTKKKLKLDKYNGRFYSDKNDELQGQDLNISTNKLTNDGFIDEESITLHLWKNNESNGIYIKIEL